MCKAWLNAIVHSRIFSSFQGFFAGPNQRSSITYAVPKTKKGCAANIHRPGPLKPTLLHWRHIYTLCFHPSTSTKHIDNLCGRQWYINNTAGQKSYYSYWAATVLMLEYKNENNNKTTATRVNSSRAGNVPYSPTSLHLENMKPSAASTRTPATNATFRNQRSS